MGLIYLFYQLVQSVVAVSVVKFQVSFNHKVRYSQCHAATKNLLVAGIEQELCVFKGQAVKHSSGTA